MSLIDFYEEIGAPFLETMCCRYNPGGNFTLHNEIMDTPKDAKYGMTKEQMKEAFTKLKAHGVKHFGNPRIFSIKYSSTWLLSEAGKNFYLSWL